MRKQRFCGVFRCIGFIAMERCKTQTLTLTKSSADYRANLAPVLRYARKLALVDPYLKCSKQYTDTISICSDLLGDRGHSRVECQLRSMPRWIIRTDTVALTIV